MPDSPRPGTKTDYIRRIDDLVNQVKRMEDEAARRAARLLLEAQREITQRVITAEGWRLENLQSLQRQVNDILARFEREYTAALSGIQVDAYQLGAESVDDPLRVSGVTLAPARLNPAVISVLQGFSADLIRNVSAETRAAVNATIAQSLLGLQSPFEAQKRITQIIGAHDRLGELTGISARAESQFRTETGRVYSIATQARQEQVAELVPDLMKAWVATGDTRTRSGHLDAHGQTVKVDEFFEVAPYRGAPKERLKFPRDPRGSAANTINCRCRPVTWRAGYGEILPRTTARVEKERERRANEFAWTT